MNEIMLGIDRSDEPYYEVPAAYAIKNELARKLYSLLDEFEDLKTYQVEEVLEAGYKYFNSGKETYFEEESPFDDMA